MSLINQMNQKCLARKLAVKRAKDNNSEMYDII